MSNIEEEVKKCIEISPETKETFDEIVIYAATVCTKLAQQFRDKFLPDGKSIQLADNFAYKEEFAIVIFREACLWWNAQKSRFPIGNHYENNGGAPLNNIAITMYICQQIKVLEQRLEDNGIEVGQLELHDHLDIPADEIINRDITKVLNLGNDEEMPDIIVPDANSSRGNIYDDEKAIIDQKPLEFNNSDEYPEREIPDIDSTEIEELIRGMKDLKPGQKIHYKGKVITILAPVCRNDNLATIDESE